MCWLIPILGCMICGLLGYFFGRSSIPDSSKLVKVTQNQVSFIPADIIKSHGTYQGLLESYESLKSQQTSTNKIDDFDVDKNEMLMTLAADVEKIPDNKIIHHSAYQYLQTQYDKLQSETVQLKQQINQNFEIVPNENQLELEKNHNQLQAEIKSINLEHAEQINLLLHDIDTLKIENKTLISDKTDSLQTIEAHVKTHPDYLKLEEGSDYAKIKIKELQNSLELTVSSFNQLKVKYSELESRQEKNEDTNLTLHDVENISETSVKLHKTYQTLYGKYLNLKRQLNALDDSELKDIEKTHDYNSLENHDLKVEIKRLKGQLIEKIKKEKLNSLSSDLVRSIPDDKIKIHQAFVEMSEQLVSLQSENKHLKTTRSNSSNILDDIELMELRDENKKLNEKLEVFNNEANQLESKELSLDDILNIPADSVSKHRTYRSLLAKHKELKHAYDSLSKERSSFVANQIAEKSTLKFNQTLANSIFKKPVRENDLTIVEGITLNVAGLLMAEGISTWYTLSQTSIERCQEILNNSGSRNQSNDPSTWPRQAKMAFEGKWLALYTWQERLNQRDSDFE